MLLHDLQPVAIFCLENERKYWWVVRWMLKFLAAGLGAADWKIQEVVLPFWVNIGVVLKELTIKPFQCQHCELSEQKWNEQELFTSLKLLLHLVCIHRQVLLSWLNPFKSPFITAVRSWKLFNMIKVIRKSLWLRNFINSDWVWDLCIFRATLFWNLEQNLWDSGFGGRCEHHCHLPTAPSFVQRYSRAPSVSAGQRPLYTSVCWGNLDPVLGLSAQGRGYLSCPSWCLWVTLLTSRGGFS